jgi:hypothetical protein
MGVAAYGPRAGLDLDQDEPARCQDERVDLVDAPLVVDELEVRPSAPRLVIGEVSAEEIKRLALPLE